MTRTDDAAAECFWATFRVVESYGRYLWTTRAALGGEVVRVAVQAQQCSRVFSPGGQAVMRHSVLH